MPAPERKALQKTFRWVLVDKIQAFFRHPMPCYGRNVVFLLQVFARCELEGAICVVLARALPVGL